MKNDVVWRCIERQE